MPAELESRRRTALVALRAGLVSVDGAGTIRLDDVARSLVGTDATELTRDALTKLFDPAFESETILQLERAAHESPPRDVYLPIVAREGTRWLRLRLADGDATGERQGTLLDVTLHEQDRSALARQLRYNESFARLAARLLEASTVAASIHAVEEEVASPLDLDFAVVELFEENDPRRAELERLLTHFGEVAFIRDVRDSKLAPFARVAELPRLRTLVSAPIVVDGVLIGSVTAGTIDQPRFLADDDVAFFGSVVALASGAIGAKRLAERHQQMEAKLAQAQKMESLGVLAGGIAHDFNNLLVGILGNAGLALSALPADSPGRAELRSLRLAALRASDLTKQLLAYAGRAQFEVARVDVRRVVEEMGALLAAAIPKNVYVHYDFADVPTFVDADVTQLRQVFMNLLTNASDAIGSAEGTVQVSVRRAQLASSYFSDALFGEAKPAGRYALVTVTDTGAGMSPEVRSRIFDPFFTTKGARKGTGLGLSISYGIVEEHGGAIEAESSPSGGAVFRLEFPVATRKPVNA